MLKYVINNYFLFYNLILAVKLLPCLLSEPTASSHDTTT